MIKARVSIKELRQEPYVLNASERLHNHLLNLGFNADFYTCGQYGMRCLTRDEEEYLLQYKNKGTFIIAFNKLCYNVKGE